MRLSAAETRFRFAGARVARLATVSADGVPHLVPVTLAVLGDRVVFVVDHKPKSTTRLRRLDNIAARPAVCLLVDVYDDDWTRLWWARADGTGPRHRHRCGRRARGPIPGLRRATAGRPGGVDRGDHVVRLGRDRSGRHRTALTAHTTTPAEPAGVSG